MVDQQQFTEYLEFLIQQSITRKEALFTTAQLAPGTPMAQDAWTRYSLEAGRINALQEVKNSIEAQHGKQPSKPKYPPIGSISEATMRPQDLIPKFHDELSYYNEPKAEELAEEFQDIFAALNDDWFDDRYGWSTPEEIEFSEQAGYLLEALFDALNEIAPPYTSFGSHEGDGACYGWWVDYDAVQEQQHWGEILDVREDEDGNEVLYQKLAGGRLVQLPEYAAHVTDHGNVTLYRVKWELEEVWSVV